jgi:glutamate racemase
MTKPTVYSVRRTALLLLPLLILSCGRPSGIRDAILNHRDNFYYVDFGNYPAGDATLPVGIFDSGTGGLSVMADIIKHEGLANESYVYLGDLANMPYGSYSLENNTELLIEHVMKDVQFLLGNKYYRNSVSDGYETDKRPVKAIVIACNTATAFALDTVRQFLGEAGLKTGVIGVVDAGVTGAFNNFSAGENGSIAVMATDGTVKSGAFPRAIMLRNKADGKEEDIRVFQQAGIGIAEAIDGSADAIDRKARAPRKDYKGPSDIAGGDFKIDMSIWQRYDFDTDNGALLFEGDAAAPHGIQINSVENYIAFHVVSLMEKIRKSEDALPLNSVILACTHYPFYEETFRKEFDRLRDYSENGDFIYRPLIAGDLTIVNPAEVVAQQLYDLLAEGNLLNPNESEGAEFYISVPNLRNRNISLRDDGSFTYEYKYSRPAGDIQEYVRVVPFSRSSITDEILGRLAGQIPALYDMIVSFNNENPKTDYLREEEKIVRE